MPAELLTSFFDDVFEPMRLRSRSDNTRRLYRTTFRTFARFLGRPATLDDLTDLTVSKFLRWYRSQGRSPASVNKEHANLTALWRFACQRRYVQDWPTVQRDIEPQREPQAWLDYEIQRLFDACEHEAGKIGDVAACDFWRALLLCLWDTGERISAVVGLTWANVDLKGGWVRVPAEIRKGKRADRLYQLSAQTTEALKKIKTKPGMVFRWPYCRTYLWRRFGEVLDHAGLPHDGRSKFHRIRRTVASYYEAAGGDATKLLGHSHRRTTLAYLDSRIVGIPQPCERLFRLGKAAKKVR